MYYSDGLLALFTSDDCVAPCSQLPQEHTELIEASASEETHSIYCVVIMRDRQVGYTHMREDGSRIVQECD